MTSFDAKKLQNVEKEIEEKVGKENAEKYLRLAKKWATGKMSLKTFERKSTSIIPIDVHSEFILYLSEAFNINLTEAPKKKKSKMKSVNQDTIESLTKLVHITAIKEDIWKSSPSTSSEHSTDKYNELIAEIIKYAQLVDSEVKTDSMGFQFLKPIVFRKEISLSDIIKSIRKFEWILPPEADKEAFITALQC